MIDVNGREWIEDSCPQNVSGDRVLGLINGVCQRCLNESDEWFGTFKFQGRVLQYCRKCLDFVMVTNETGLIRSSIPAKISPNAHELTADFQLSDLQRGGAVFAKEQFEAGGKALIWAVCGAGKTEMMFMSISAALEQGKRVCWAIPRADVVIELLPRLRQAFPKARVVGLHGRSEEKALYGDIVVTTVHQLIRFYQAFGLMIIDEVDAFPYTFDEMLPRLAKKACAPGCGVIYLSATPSKSIRQEKLACCLIPARYHGQPLDVPKFQWCGTFKEVLPKSVKKWVQQKLAQKRRALIFVPTIECGYRLRRLLQKQLQLEVDFVYSSHEERLEKVRRFKEGIGQFLITTMILERGVTIVDIDVAIISAEHEVFEESALVQISGRVGRSPRYPHGEIIFFHGGVTLAMDRARGQIKNMNRAARKSGVQIKTLGNESSWKWLPSFSNPFSCLFCHKDISIGGFQDLFTPKEILLCRQCQSFLQKASGSALFQRNPWVDELVRRLNQGDLILTKLLIHEVRCAILPHLGKIKEIVVVNDKDDAKYPWLEILVEEVMERIPVSAFKGDKVLTLIAEFCHKKAECISVFSE